MSALWGGPSLPAGSMPVDAGPGKRPAQALQAGSRCRRPAHVEALQPLHPVEVLQAAVGDLRTVGKVDQTEVLQRFQVSKTRVREFELIEDHEIPDRLQCPQVSEVVIPNGTLTRERDFIGTLVVLRGKAVNLASEFFDRGTRLVRGDVPDLQVDRRR